MGIILYMCQNPEEFRFLHPKTSERNQLPISIIILIFIGPCKHDISVTELHAFTLFLLCVCVYVCVVFINEEAMFSGL